MTALGGEPRRTSGPFGRWYGAGPLHLLALLASFGLAGYAAQRLLVARPVAIVVWLAAAVIGHDLILLPLYAIADRSAQLVLRHRGTAQPARSWVNFVRVPALLSGLLLLVWFPLIARLPKDYHALTGEPVTPFFGHWLGVTGVLFAVSAFAFAIRLRRDAGGTGPAGH